MIEDQKEIKEGFLIAKQRIYIKGIENYRKTENLRHKK